MLIQTKNRLGRLTLFVLIALAFVFASVPTQTISANEDRTPVSGTLIIHDTSVNCHSPVGICSQGTITGNKLNGEVSGEITSLAPVFTNSQLSGYYLTGTSTISTKNGDLYGTAELTQTLPYEAGSGTFTLTSGTKKYKHTVGVLKVTAPNGPVNGSQTFYYTGYITKGDEGD